jgi:hypothetical protein
VVERCSSLRVLCVFASLRGEYLNIGILRTQRRKENAKKSRKWENANFPKLDVAGSSPDSRSIFSITCRELPIREGLEVIDD